MRFALYLAVLLAWTLEPTVALAHDYRPLLIRIIEQPVGRYDIRWRDSPVLAADAQPTIELRGLTCTPDERATTTSDIRRLIVSCTDTTSPRELVLRYPNDNPSLSTLVHLTTADGSFIRRIGPPGENEIDLQASPSSAVSARAYLLIGFDHILRGIDHLLFLVALCLVAGRGWTLIRAVTGFTIGHSLTLAVSALGLASPPSALIEALIALSIAFVAVEALARDRSTLTWRHPASVAALFGLLHGFGFAGYLRDVGLPKDDEIAALFFFNVGVELGQLLFVGAVTWITAAYARSARALEHLALARHATAYTIGGLATFWFIQRLASS